MGKRIMRITLLIAAFIFTLVLSGKNSVNAAVKTPAVLSGASIKTKGNIYYSIGKVLYRYDEKTKKIKKIHKFGQEVGWLHQYRSYLYIQTNGSNSSNSSNSSIYRYSLKTMSTKLFAKHAVFCGIIGKKVYCTVTKDNKESFIYLKEDGTQTVIFENIVKKSKGGSGIQGIEIWDGKIYYSQEEEKDAVTEKNKSESKEDEDEDEENNYSYHYMTEKGEIKDITRKKYNTIVSKYFSFMSYPEKGVSNMISSGTQVQYGHTTYVYYSVKDNKKEYLEQLNKKNKRKKIYSIKLNKKKYKYRYLFPCNSFKGQVMVAEESCYKKKKNGYAGNRIYRLLNDKGKVIKTLGKLKLKKMYRWGW